MDFKSAKASSYQEDWEKKQHQMNSPQLLFTILFIEQSIRTPRALFPKRTTQPVDLIITNSTEGQTSISRSSRTLSRN